jgi:hypothetical protein
VELRLLLPSVLSLAAVLKAKSARTKLVKLVKFDQKSRPFPSLSRNQR